MTVPPAWHRVNYLSRSPRPSPAAPRAAPGPHVIAPAPAAAAAL